MAVRRRRRKPAVVKEPIIEEEVIEEEVIEEEVEEPVAKPRRRRSRTAVAKPEAVEKAAPPTRKRRTRKAAPPKQEVATQEEFDDGADDVEDETVVEAEAPKTRRTRKPRKQQEEDESYIGTGDLLEVLRDLVDGGTVVTCRKVGNKFAFHKAGLVTLTANSGKRQQAMTNSAFESIAYHPDFIEFYASWKDYTYEEKLQLAADEKIEWEEHETPKINLMRLSTAYRREHGIEKWRPEYATREARDALRYQGIKASPIED